MIERTKKFAQSLFRLFVRGALLLVLLALIINFYVYESSKAYIIDGGKKIEKISGFDAGSGADVVPVAILLGASVYSDGRLSPLLEDRANKTIELYQSGVVKKILVSGDNHTKNYNEVIPTREYLVAAGVPAEDVFVDYAGFNTYDSLYRAQAIFGVRQAVVVTQKFHLPRAIFAARRLGLDAYGVPADPTATSSVPATSDPAKYDPVTYDRSSPELKNNFREFFAVPKTFFEVLFHLKPHFLGAKEEVV